MKKVSKIILLAVVSLLFATPALAYVSVKGYYRSNGTYVAPYVRSSPNALKYDNYSYTGGSLYNKSYYTPTKSYSSSWYTPSYTTDSNYYTGKSIYSSKYKY